MRKFKTLCAAALLAGLLACSKPVPAERAAYVGEWHGATMQLLITQDGQVIYRRKEGNVTKNIDAPLKEFEGNNFVVGIGPMSTTFVVTAPPHQAGQAWKMTVDGEELTKQGPPAPGASSA